MLKTDVVPAQLWAVVAFLWGCPTGTVLLYYHECDSEPLLSGDNTVLTHGDAKNMADIFKCILLKETFCNMIQISQRLVQKDTINEKSMVQLMARHQTGDKPLPEPAMTQLTDAWMRP